MDKADRENTIVDMYVNGHSFEDIMAVSGYNSRSSVFSVLNRHGVKLNRGKFKGPLGKRKPKDGQWAFVLAGLKWIFLRIRAICFLFSLIFSIFILTLSSIEYGRTYRFYSGFLCYRKDSESYIRWFQQEWLPSWPINGDRVFACLDYRIRICMFFMFLSFYRRLSDCLVRAEGTPWDKGGLSFSVTLSGWQSRRQRDMLLSLQRIL